MAILKKKVTTTTTRKTEWMFLTNIFLRTSSSSRSEVLFCCIMSNMAFHEFTIFQFPHFFYVSFLCNDSKILLEFGHFQSCTLGNMKTGLLPSAPDAKSFRVSYIHSKRAVYFNTELFPAQQSTWGWREQPIWSVYTLSSVSGVVLLPNRFKQSLSSKPRHCGDK